MSESTETQKAIQSALIAVLAFSLMSVFVKEAQKTLPVEEVMFVRSLLHFAFAYLLLKRKGLSIVGHKMFWLVMRGVVGFTGFYAYFHSLKSLELGDATVIQYLSPLFSIVLSFVVFKEKPSLGEWVAIALGCTGMILIVRPSFIFGHSHYAFSDLLLAVWGAIAGSMVFLIMRGLRHSEHPNVVIIYFPMVAGPLIAPAALSVWEWPSITDWFWLWCVGIATQIGQSSWASAAQLAPAKVTTPFFYIQIVLAFTWGVLFFHEVPKATSIGGTLLIFFGIFISVYSKREGPEKTN